MKGKNKSKKHGGRAALWLLMPLAVLLMLKTNFLTQLAGPSHSNSDSIVVSEASAASTPEISGNVNATEDHNQISRIEVTNGPKDSSLTNPGVAAPVSSKLTCNFSSHQTNTCEMEGDVRIHGKSATVYVVSSSTYKPENATVKLRPYARKWEDQVMLLAREVTILSSPPGGNGAAAAPPPECSARHNVPAVVFSTGGYNRNIFHIMADVIIPLYLTAREYNGRVQLLATDYEPKWIAKHRAILAALSTLPVMDMDADDAVHCFPSARVGLENHRELGIDPALSRHGYTMTSFRNFIRSTYALPRPWAEPVSRRSGRRPRLALLLRRNTRRLTNEEQAIAAARDAGFEVIPSGPDEVSDLARFAGVVNSCDVLVGVHGAGLTNMLFLPHNATVVQIVPWGEIKYPCRHSYGDPVPAMGLRYAEYEASAEETTLRDKYPRDHAVFTDPLSIHRQGFDKMWNIFMNGQDVILDTNRFGVFMKELYNSITTD